MEVAPMEVAPMEVAQEVAPMEVAPGVILPGVYGGIYLFFAGNGAAGGVGSDVAPAGILGPGSYSCGCCGIAIPLGHWCSADIS